MLVKKDFNKCILLESKENTNLKGTLMYINKLANKLLD